ncbi:MAG: hypothetical protein SNH27_10340 [Rikenellaceae bacterium]
MKDIYQQETYKGFNINIERDPDAQSPRDWSTLGTMYTMHRNYQPEKNFYNHFEWEEVFDEHRELLDSFEKKYIALKFYLYDHSGQTVSTSPFSCGWDSGLFGIIAVDIERVREEYNWKHITKKRREKIEDILRCEVEIYDQYITGDVYGYTISEVENEDNTLDDSCWGFFGDDGIEQIIEEAKGYIDQHVEDPKTIKRSEVIDKVKSFAKELFNQNEVAVQLKFSY